MKVFLFLVVAISAAGCKKLNYNLDDGDVEISQQGVGKHRFIIKTSTAAVISVRCETFTLEANRRGKCKSWMRIKAGADKGREKYCDDNVPDFTSSTAVKRVIIMTREKTTDTTYTCTVSTSGGGGGSTTTSSPVTGDPSNLNYTGCGIQGSRVGEIVGGQDADIGEWPWQVYLGGCGGTILSNDCVLTAAHCISDSKLNGGFNVYAGVHDRRILSSDPNVQKREAKKAVKHPDYKSGVADVAIIKLKTPFDFSKNSVDSACLPTPGYGYAGQDGTATGFGRTIAGGSGANILQEATYPIKDNSDSVCRNRKDFILCAASPTMGTCNGDSGGPMAVQGGDDKWSVVGVNSYGVTSNCINPDFFMRVTSYMDFITTHCG